MTFQDVANEMLERLKATEATDRKALSKAEREVRAREKQQATDLWNKGVLLVERAQEIVLDRCQVLSPFLGP